MTVVLAVGALACAVVGVAWLTVHRLLVVVTVDGPSMRPTLRPGDRVLVRRAPMGAVRTGQMVVVRRPVNTELPGLPVWLIKRAAAVPGEPVPAAVRTAVGHHRVPTGSLVVLGDNPAESADSRHWGYVTEDRFLGVVRRTMGRVRSR